MKSCKEHGNRITRREFCRKSALLTAGAVGYAAGIRPAPAHASIPANRVIWVHDEDATSWDGVTGHYRDFVDQAKVNGMLDRGMKELTGTTNLSEAWQQVIPNYSVGKKIVIKLNINNSGTSTNIDALPHPVNAVIRGLKSAGVAESDIYVVEPSRVFPTAIGDPILALYPGVLIWDVIWGQTYGHGVTYNSSDSSLTVRHALYPAIADSKLPDQLGEADYLINIPIVKGHWDAGITLTFKNNFGFFESGSNISKFHDATYLDSPNFNYQSSPLLDLYQNSHIGNKTILIVGDMLFAHRISNIGTPAPWDTFGGNFPNSLFLSSNPVAIDSVMWDFSNAEYAKNPDAQLYLHRAQELGYGIHEHWNNAIDRQYALIDFKKFDMNVITRLDVDRKIRDHKEGTASEQDVKDVINQYME